MGKINLWLILFLAAGLASCKMGPDYKRPEADMPEKFRHVAGEQDKAETGESIAARNWKEIYLDEKLQQLIETALTHNLDLEIALSRIRESRSRFMVSRSYLFPDLGLGGEFEREKSGSSGNTDNTFTLLGLLSWEIDIWGANQRAAEAAQAAWYASRQNREALEVSLIGEIATAYFDLLDIDNQLRISKQTVNTRLESVRIAKLREEGGVISELEVRQSELELATAEITLPKLLRDRLMKENQLRLLLGQIPGDIERGLDINEQLLPPEVPVGLPSTLLQRRPDIRQAEEEMIAANALIGVAKAGYLPKLVLTGEYGRESDELNDLLESGSEAWLLGLEAAMPIFNAGRTSAEVAIALEQFEQAKLNYEKVILRSLQEVSNSLETYHRTQEGLEIQIRRLASAREYVRLANLKYYNGILSYLDLLDAQRQLFTAELSHSESVRNRLVSFVQLYKALGGGWQGNEEPADPSE